MSHEISEIDRQQGIEQAWHGLTEVMPVIVLRKCWLACWDVTKKVLGVQNDTGEFVPGEFCQLVCTDKPEIQIGAPVHCDTYSVLSNQSFLAIVQDALDKIRGAVVASVGSVCRRGRIFVTLRVPKMETFQAAGREFKPYLNFLSSHDKSAPFTVILSTVCTVCNNTFGMNLVAGGQGTLKIVIKHTKDMANALADVSGIIDAYFASVQKFAEVMDKLAEIPVSAADAHAFFAGLLTEHKEATDEGFSTRTENQIDRLTVLFATGKGNKGENYSDVFSAVTDYYSHESVNSEGDNPEKQFASSEFGSGQAMKAFAFAVLQDDKRIAKLTASGHKAIAARASYLKAQALAQ